MGNEGKGKVKDNVCARLFNTVESDVVHGLRETVSDVCLQGKIRNFLLVVFMPHLNYIHLYAP